MEAAYHIINMYRLVTGSCVYVPLTRAETENTTMDEKIKKT